MCFFLPFFALILCLDLCASVCAKFACNLNSFHILTLFQILAHWNFAHFIVFHSECVCNNTPYKFIYNWLNVPFNYKKCIWCLKWFMDLLQSKMKKNSFKHLTFDFNMKNGIFCGFQIQNDYFILLFGSLNTKKRLNTFTGNWVQTHQNTFFLLHRSVFSFWRWHPNSFIELNISHCWCFPIKRRWTKKFSLLQFSVCVLLPLSVSRAFSNL